MSNTYKHKFLGKLSRAWVKKNWELSQENTSKVLREFPKQHNSTLYRHWTGYTPSWYNSLYHQRPFRRNGKNELKKISLENHIEADISTIHRKPHIYYF
jgi:hypothetical protein